MSSISDTATRDQNSRFTRDAMSKGDEDLANRFWDLANYITGFAVLQGITFSIAVPTSALRSAVVHDRLLPVILTLASAAVYIVAVQLCFRSERSLRRAAQQSEQTILHSRGASRMRCAAVLLVNGVVTITIILLRP